MTRKEIEARCDALKADLLAEHDRVDAKAPAEVAYERIKKRPGYHDTSGIIYLTQGY